MKQFHGRLAHTASCLVAFAFASLAATASAQVVVDNGVPVTGLSAPEGGQLTFLIEVPADAYELLVQTSAGTGDADLFIRQGELPTFVDYDCASFTGGNQDACLIDTPAEGDWYILVDAWEAFEGLVLVASFDGEPAQIIPLEADVDLPVAGPAGSINWFSVEVPADAAEVVVEIFPEAGATGDGDLFVRYQQRPLPNGSDWDCRPFEAGNTEECVLTDPAAGTWFVGVHAWPDAGELANVRILASGDLTPPEPPAVPSNLEVTLSGRRMRPDHTLTWIGGGEDIDVLRNGVVVFSGPNTGSYVQNVPAVLGASDWQVCNAGTPECSD